MIKIGAMNLFWVREDMGMKSKTEFKLSNCINPPSSLILILFENVKIVKFCDNEYIFD